MGPGDGARSGTAGSDVGPGRDADAGPVAPPANVAGAAGSRSGRSGPATNAQSVSPPRAAPTSEGSASTGRAGPGQRGGHPEHGERADAGQADRQPPGRRQAEQRREAGEQQRRPDQQRDLVVRAEEVDGELLERLGHQVDHETAHGDQRGGPGTGQDGHRLGDAECHHGGDDTGQCRGTAGDRAHAAQSGRPAGSAANFVSVP